MDLHTVTAAQLGESPDRLGGPGVATHSLVKDHLDGVVLEVGPDVGEEVPCLLAYVHVGGIVDALLALVDPLVVGDLVFLATGDVANLLKTQQDRVVVPDVDRLAKDGVQRLGHVEVADATACDAGSSGAGPGLVDYDHVRPRTLAPRLEFHRQVPGRAQPMNPGPDDQIVVASGSALLIDCSLFVKWCRDQRLQTWPISSIGPALATRIVSEE